GNLSTEKQKDISDIVERFRDDLKDAGMTVRVAKALALLEFVRDLPRTEANIAACLVDRVGDPSPLTQVETALKRLEDAQFVRNTEEGWKLQTAQEKNWEAERRSYLDPKPKDRNEIVRGVLRDIFTDPKLKTYRYRNLRNFRVGVTVDGASIGNDGQIPLSVIVAEDNTEFPTRLQEIRNESRLVSHANDIYWVFSLTKEIDDLVANLHASQEMVRKYEQLRAQNRITNDELTCLQDENGEVRRRQGLLRDKMTTALENGQGLFQGLSKDAATLGKTTNEIFRNLFEFALPTLYPKLEMGTRPLKGTEPEEVLKAANLSGLSQIFYDGEKGLNLVVKDGANYVPNPNTDVAKEVVDYLNREHSYGNKETRLGKALETHFGGLGYGWERDILRLVLAVLFRAGAIEVSYQGRRYDSYQNPNSRPPFINNTAFKSSLFTPATIIDLSTLKQAVENYEALTGRTVDMEKNAIAAALIKVAEEELKLIHPLQAQVQANALPVSDQLADYKQTMDTILDGNADDCVLLLAGEGQSLKQAYEQARQIRDATTYEGIETLRQARTAAYQMWPALAAQGQDGELASQAQVLREELASPTFYSAMSQIKNQTAALVNVFQGSYRQLHKQRTDRFDEAIQVVRERPEFDQLSPEMQVTVLKPLADRSCQQIDLPPAAEVCHACRANMAQMESDLAAVMGLQGQVIVRIQKLVMPEDEPVERVRLMQFFNTPLDSENAINQALEQLRQHLQKLVDQGIKIILE
ncbi:MAG: hypothetical protein JXA42_23065, partial [Anaerolineales bacterium]|nr:hypothetical protein [Anaerolineales bacterium]